MSSLFQLKKIHHLIRYFVMLGVAVFTAYMKHWNDEIIMFLLGPPLYLAYFLREQVATLITLPTGQVKINHFGFLLPVTVVYYGLVGSLLKALWNEIGPMRFPSFYAFLFFIFYVHYLAGKNLLGYFAVFP